MRHCENVLFTTHNRLVVGSSPPGATIFRKSRSFERLCRFWRSPASVQILGIERHGAPVGKQGGIRGGGREDPQQRLHPLLAAP